MSAEQTTLSLLANNQGTLTQTLPASEEFFATLLESVNAEPVTVGAPPVRNVRKEIRRSFNQGGRRTARRASKLFRAERSRELKYARNRGSKFLKSIVDDLPGVGEATGLLDKLTAMANEELDAGSRLTAGEQRTAEQAARSAFSARGLANSDPAAAAEVLNRHNFGYSRLRDRQRFAQGLIGQQMARSQMYDPITRLGLGTGSDAKGVMLPAMGMAQSIQNQDAAAQLGITQQQASIDSAASLQNASLATQANLQQNQYMYDDYNTRLNHLYGQQIAQGNLEAARAAAGSGLAGSIGGSALGAIGSIFGGGGGGLLGGLFS